MHLSRVVSQSIRLLTHPVVMLPILAAGASVSARLATEPAIPAAPPRCEPALRDAARRAGEPWRLPPRDPAQRMGCSTLIGLVKGCLPHGEELSADRRLVCPAGRRSGRLCREGSLPRWRGQTEWSTDSAGVAVALGSYPGRRIRVPLVPVIRDRPECRLDLQPSVLVVHCTPDSLGDEGTPSPAPNSCVELSDESLVQTYV